MESLNARLPLYLHRSRQSPMRVVRVRECERDCVTVGLASHQQEKREMSLEGSCRKQLHDRGMDLSVTDDLCNCEALTHGHALTSTCILPFLTAFGPCHGRAATRVCCRPLTVCVRRI